MKKGQHHTKETIQKLSIAEKGKSKIKRICEHCNKEFYVYKWYIEQGKGKYCSTKCNGESKKERIKILCKQCGKEFEATKWQIEKNRKFCSVKCKGMATSGKNSATWKGGISFEPYCPKFNNKLKERIRAFFEYRCIACGKHENELKRKLYCHHVEYNKQACCDGKPIHFAAMCSKHHAMTNHYREQWETMIHRIIDEIYNGKSYYTEEEYNENNRINEMEQ
jgi:hypothetical protein